MILLLDAGNSRLKWALCSANSVKLHQQGICHYYQPDQINRVCQKYCPDAVYALAVCGPKKKDWIQTQIPQPIQWQHAKAEAMGIVCNYDNPAQLGADRWFNILGGRYFNQQGALLVVSCGTAMTLDVLAENNYYLGGSICPGIQMMHQALGEQTAQLKQPLGHFADFARNTQDALMSGIIDASIGAINRIQHRLSFSHPKSDVKIVLTGGNAHVLHPFLDKKNKIIDNLALFGLASWVMTQ